MNAGKHRADVEQT